MQPGARGAQVPLAAEIQAIDRGAGQRPQLERPPGMGQIVQPTAELGLTLDEANRLLAGDDRADRPSRRAEPIDQLEPARAVLPMAGQQKSVHNFSRCADRRSP